MTADELRDEIRLVKEKTKKPFAVNIPIVFPQSGDLLDAALDLPPVGFNLRLAGAAQKTEDAALAFKMGPGPNQTAFLVIQMGKFDLQAPFPRLRAHRVFRGCAAGW